MLEHEDGGGVLLRNVGWIFAHYMALYPRKLLIFISASGGTSNSTRIALLSLSLEREREQGNIYIYIYSYDPSFVLKFVRT
jgi:hypothetical protein